MSDEIIDINTKEPVVAIKSSQGDANRYCDCRRYAQSERALIGRLAHMDEEYKRRHESVEGLRAEEQRVKSRIRAAKNSLLNDMGV